VKTFSDAQSEAELVEIADALGGLSARRGSE